MEKQEIDELIEKWTAYALDEGRRSDIKSAIRHVLEEYAIMWAGENSVSQHVSDLFCVTCNEEMIYNGLYKHSFCPSCKTIVKQI